ncbi:MAG: hypothetical protein M1476_06590 [Candidatus Thermoplasmatota archaeon]|nr:hypothetical protein [Candidatus Thermoplasmatota archaeon]
MNLTVSNSAWVRLCHFSRNIHLFSVPESRKNEIIAEIRRSDDSKYDHRLNGPLLAANGVSPYGVYDVIGNSPKITA